MKDSFERRCHCPRHRPAGALRVLSLRAHGLHQVPRGLGWGDAIGIQEPQREAAELVAQRSEEPGHDHRREQMDEPTRLWFVAEHL